MEKSDYFFEVFCYFVGFFRRKRVLRGIMGDRDP